MHPGEIHLHRRFYADPETGELRDKYFIVLATTPGGDLVIRLLTSRQNDRPVDPPCFHGDPYPGFYLGTPGGQLNRPSWVDLRYLDDADPLDARRGMERGYIALVWTLEPGQLRSVLECAANANDTTRLQERAMRDQMAMLPA
jgi:hypothetical protein